MKAVWYTHQGPPAEVMQFGEQPTSHAAVGEVRVRLHASGVNPADANRCNGSIAYYASRGNVAPVVSAPEVMRRNLAIHGILLNGAPHAARKRAQSDIVQRLREGGLLHTVSAVYSLVRTADAHAAVE